jgi:hypothetical protein
MLVAKGFTSASAHISASSAGIGNFIFKTNSNTADTIISGSSNLFTNATAPTAGFKRYIGGSGNIMLNASNVAQISSSMTFSPTMNNNYFGGSSTTLTMRGPVSSSTYTISANNVLGTINIGSSDANHARGIQSGLTMSGNNVLNSTLNIIANQSALSSSVNINNNTIAGTTTLNLSSSAVTANQNYFNSTGTITNAYYSSSVGLGTLTFSRNIINGSSNTVTVSGSLPAGATNQPQVAESMILGTNNTLFTNVAESDTVSTTAQHTILSTAAIGHNIVVSGSSAAASNNFGSVFVGRYNAIDTNRAKTAQTIFAVGTGTSTTRKTGFLIDSGSNTFVEGTLNVSGATSLNGNLNITGSLTASLQQGFVYVGNASGITTTVATSSFAVNTSTFATTGSNFFNGNQRITGSLIVSGAFETTQDITIQDASGNPTLKIGRGAGNQPSNLRFGVQALATTDVGLNNIAIGNSAMHYSSQSLATENIAIGGESLQYNQEGQQIAIGTSALRYTTTGKENLAIGAFAMQNNITGTQNLAIGFNSLYNHTDGTRNIAIGPSSAQNFRSGSNNIFIGYQTGNSISGSNNVILGAYNGTGETINNNIILADGAGNKELQFSGSTWTTENNFVVSGSLSAANNIKMGRGVDKPTNKVTVGSGGLIVSNSLVTSDSYIFATNDTTVGNYSPVVSNITAGSFSLSNGGYGGNIDVMYMIVNPY